MSNNKKMINLLNELPSSISRTVEYESSNMELDHFLIIISYLEATDLVVYGVSRYSLHQII